MNELGRINVENKSSINPKLVAFVYAILIMWEGFPNNKK